MLKHDVDGRNGPASADDDGVRLVTGRLKKGGRAVQSVVFNPDAWSVAGARAYLRQHRHNGFARLQKSAGGSLVFEQRAPEAFVPGSFAVDRVAEHEKKHRDPRRTAKSSVPPGFVELTARIVKTDAHKQLVFGEVYVPNVPDTQGDFMSAEEIEKAAHEFMRQRRNANVDTNHDNKPSGGFIVESFLARDGDPDFKVQGTWVAVAHLPLEQFERVLNRELTGFSLEALVRKVSRDVFVQVDDKVNGVTGPWPLDGPEQDRHRHRFWVRFNDDGDMIEGFTDLVTSPGQDDPHWHVIEENTVTGTDVFEEGATTRPNGHRHGWSILDRVTVRPRIGDPARPSGDRTAPVDPEVSGQPTSEV